LRSTPAIASSAVVWNPSCLAPIAVLGDLSARQCAGWGVRAGVVAWKRKNYCNYCKIHGKCQRQHTYLIMIYPAVMLSTIFLLLWEGAGGRRPNHRPESGVVFPPNYLGTVFLSCSAGNNLEPFEQRGRNVTRDAQQDQC
jgi:hypothetical protein